MQLLKDYCETSTLHGFSYLTQEKRSKLEKYVALKKNVSFHQKNSFRLLWAFMLVISIFTTCLLLFQLMEKVKSNPIITYTSDTATKITDIHFPAFIYCVPLKPARDMISYEYAIELANLERNLTIQEFVVHIGCCIND